MSQDSDHFRLLTHQLATYPSVHYPCQSRVHPLPSFDTAHTHCFVKRDDELGSCGLGSKIRKYNSLIAYFLQHKIEQVIVIGSAYSNHVLGIAQLLNQNHIAAVFFLKKQNTPIVQGNLLTTLVFTQPNQIQWISSEQWPFVKHMAETYQQLSTKKSFVLEEGGSNEQALPGALSLPLDILENEKEMGMEFGHIIVDSGTGLMACALILGYHWLNKKARIHVCLMAEDRQFFHHQLSFFRQTFNKIIKAETSFPKNFNLYKPYQLASFGSTNQTLFKEIISLARLEGILTDPIYTAKLFREAKRLIQQQKISQRTLIIHSGGTFTLTGFQKQLNEALQKVDNNQ